ncbi:MAG: Gfo/Idh/MocA family oxidoreductase [Chitinophagaceae bacterium]|nr:MAG: Gfo/Idh/MocA family oxidoreductase [Chitinophagaceae bacterium]
MSRKLRMGMIGGGIDGFIGAVHRLAANMDGKVEVVCGALSVHHDVARESGRAIFLKEDRIYTSWEEMLDRESELPEDVRMDFVSIVTPNFLHFAPAMKALEKGFHVVIEKPIAVSLDEALQLQKKTEETGRTLLLTHVYTGYPLVKHAKQLVKDQAIGKIRKITVEYRQGWLSRLSEREGNAGAAWRTDPKKAGKSSVMGDIGTHAFNLAEYISGLQVAEVCAHLTTVVDGRLLDDDGTVLLKFDNGASGVLIASQVMAGEENNIIIKIYGETGALEWHQMDPNTLLLRWQDKPTEVIKAGQPYLSAIAKANTRTPGGHPEGYLEAFANLYRNFVLTVSAELDGKSVDTSLVEFPSALEGVRGMAFIDTVVKSNQGEAKWVPFTIG